jgi:hypothetical protein
VLYQRETKDEKFQLQEALMLGSVPHRGTFGAPGGRSIRGQIDGTDLAGGAGVRRFASLSITRKSAIRVQSRLFFGLAAERFTA